MTKKSPRGAHSLTEERREQILKFLTGKTMHPAEIAGWLNLYGRTVHKDLQRLSAEGKAYIVEYSGSGVRSVPLYAVGDKEDAPMPERKRLNIEKRVRKMMSNKGEMLPAIVNVRRHWMDVALFGEYRRTA